MSSRMNAIDAFLAVASKFAEARGLSEWRVSTLVFGEGTRLKHLREGGDMGARRVARGLVWLSANWPDGADWPSDVPRPVAAMGEVT